MPASDLFSLSLLFLSAVCLPALACALLLYRTLRLSRTIRSVRRRRAVLERTSSVRAGTSRMRRRVPGTGRRIGLALAGGARSDDGGAARALRRAPADAAHSDVEAPAAAFDDVDASEPLRLAVAPVRRVRRASPGSDADFRQALVVLMFDALECWERNGGTRITLAERSGVWHVTCDDGRLRVRSMERYLTLARLPKKPRWRDVLRTAHYVLSHAPLSDDDRARVLAAEENVRSMARRRAL